MTDLEIRNQIGRFIAGELDAASLEALLEDAAWDAGDPAESLSANALRLLAERSNGDWTDAELSERLGALTRTYWFDHAPKQAFTASSAQVIQQDQRLAVPGTRHVVASV